MATISVSTDERMQVRDVSAAVRDRIPNGTDGTVTVFVRHTTAAVTVNEAESRLLGDIETALGDLVPESGWDHDALDGNADSHILASIVGPSVTVPVEDGDLAMGTWQSILFVECDGPRQRTVDVRVTAAD